MSISRSRDRKSGVRRLWAAGVDSDELRVLGQDPRDFGANVAPPRLNRRVVDYAVRELAALDFAPAFTTTFTPGAMALGDKTTFSLPEGAIALVELGR